MCASTGQGTVSGRKSFSAMDGALLVEREVERPVVADMRAALRLLLFSVPSPSSVKRAGRLALCLLFFVDDDISD